MLMSVSQFTQQLGGLRQSYQTDYMEKQKKDTLALLQAGEPNMREGGEKAETGLGATAGFAKLGESIQKVREKGQKVQKAVGQVRTAVADARNIATGQTTGQPVKSLTTKPLEDDDLLGGALGKMKATMTNIATSAKIDTTPLKPALQQPKATLQDALSVMKKKQRIRIGDGSGQPVDNDLFGKSNAGALQDLRNARAKGDNLLDTLDSRAGGVKRSVKMIGMGDDRGMPIGSKMNVRGSLTGSGDNAGNNMLNRLSSTLKQAPNPVPAKGANAPKSSNLHDAVADDDFLATKPLTITKPPATMPSEGIGGVGSKIEAGARSMLGDDAVSTGLKVASVASKGIEAGASVLDALGPIGDILGIGLSIFGGIEEHREKKEAMESSQQAEAQVKSTSAPTTKGLVAGTNVALDTSKQQGVNVASHF